MIELLSEEKSYVQNRAYQNQILTELDSHQQHKYNSVLELDCGLGKRVIQYLLVKKYPEKSIVIILNSTASLEDTKQYFEKLDLDFGYFRSNMPSKFREYVLRKHWPG